MEIIKKVEEVRKRLKSHKINLESIGLVPTMGCLHEGHRSLIRQAKKENKIVVVSIFVNPTQFSEEEDFDSYPRDIERDSKICIEEGVDYVFAPKKSEMYPDTFSTFVVPGENMTNIMCGASRPGHFRGVCTILTKLFNLISPDRAYFGEKDIQQLAIVKRLVEDMNFDIDIVGCPTIREDDGLAKSSRNLYLDKEERKSAVVIRKSIEAAEKMIKTGEKDAVKVKAIIIETIVNEPRAKIDYVEILDFSTFERIKEIKGKILIGIAVYIGSTRLIDNLTLDCD